MSLGREFSYECGQVRNENYGRVGQNGAAAAGKGDNHGRLKIDLPQREKQQKKVPEFGITGYVRLDFEGIPSRRLRLVLP